MIINRRNILMITAGPPALNPRLVKEADALVDAGFNVKVIYKYWNAWGEKMNEDLLKTKKWKAICVAGDPINKKFIYDFSRCIHKFSKTLFQKVPFKAVAIGAVARGSYHLINAARKIKADFYIGHNIGALPATVIAAHLHKRKCGFDAEDFHRNETTNDAAHPDVTMMKIIEDMYYSRLAYLTAASPIIAKQYRTLYPGLNVSSILNVFPKFERAFFNFSTPNKLKLFWFSQTIGTDRGLEDIIKAIGLVQDVFIELHLLGSICEHSREQLLLIADHANVSRKKLFFYEPINPDSIILFASQFDIGLATETGIPFNRDICLTNKIFSYIQGGLAVLASNTQAQQQLLTAYKNIGTIYPKGNVEEIASTIKLYNTNRALLHEQKLSSFQLGQTKLNWNLESKKFIEIVESNLL